MERTITAIYEDGLLRPLQTLDLPEHKPVQLKIVWHKKTRRAESRRTEYARTIRVLKQRGLIQESAKPPHTRRRVSEKRRRELARALSVGKPLSEIIIEERDEKA